MSEEFRATKINMNCVDIHEEILAVLSTNCLYREKAKRIGHFVADLLKLEEEEKIIASLKIVIDIMTNVATDYQVAQPVLMELCSHLINLNRQVSKPVSIYLLEKIKPRVIVFERHIVNISQYLAVVYEEDGDHHNAAEVLLDINLDSYQISFSSEYKVKTYVHISRLLLKDNDASRAEFYLLRAANFLPEVSNAMLVLDYELCYALVLEYRKKFIEAAQKYFKLFSNTVLKESERPRTLRDALVCTILSPSGTPKSRMLRTLFNDERCQTLPEYGILSMMHLEKIIRKPDVLNFKALLPPRHMDLPDGCTSLDLAVIENNLIAISKAYNNIHIDNLGALLDITPLEAERAVAEMIRNELINGSIDRVDYIVYFEHAEVQQQADDQIQKFCSEIDQICDLLAKTGEEEDPDRTT